ncbi:hypothetical protein ACFLTS_04170 [Chloroflexota bacterium]
MSRKAKLVASILIIIVLGSAIGIGSAVLAQESTPAPDNETVRVAPTLWGEVATILEIDEQQLRDAVEQANQELILEKAVEKGIITDEEAAEIMEWWSQRQADLYQKLAPKRFGCFVGTILGRGISNEDLIAKVAEILGLDEQQLSDAIEQAKQERNTEVVDNWLDTWLEKAVGEGIITEEEAGQIEEWWGQKPDVIPHGLGLRGPGIFTDGKRGMMRGMGGMMHGNRIWGQTQDLPGLFRGETQTTIQTPAFN